MLRVLFFARVREQVGCDSLELPWSEDRATVHGLLSGLCQRGPQWQAALGQPNLVVAVNQRVADSAARLQAGDEVAFFPPVTGG
ncbi:molybdopterin converting factor subunit 1 [Haliea sp. E1-2-M8]|uniref:molybdopterin converting factor subunit 1 n=1 Tax=Haliea sp. E1-2-M8 TaxID=3064706 RepID=UPI0027182D29|nr:molybdopterin converting factor subunit 1 [Haliea sp. E1-2-M8]MDO8861899.1 molybdopterin converting factor subunit 1 [Haliea sp. E1-2-M8]